MATVNGTSGNDTISGFGGNDLFLAGSTGGADVIDGGTGFDSIEFRERATSAVVVNFTTGSISGGSSGTISFTNVERVVAGNFNDSLTGNVVSQTLTGSAGLDTLWGAGGADTLWGGADADTFIFRETGTANADRINDFASGSDKILLDPSVMSALGASGNFAAGDDRFVANSAGTAQDAEDRIVFNTTTKQVFYDADGNGSGAAVLIATLQSSATLVATDIVVEGEDTPPGGGQTINGTSGDDALFSGPDDDTINGFGGNDSIFMVDEFFDSSDNPGNDAIDGGDGIDFVTFSRSETGSTEPVVVDLAAGTYSTSDSASGTLTSIENAQGSLYDDELRGTDGPNLLAAGQGNDTLDGRAGNDTLLGGAHADSLHFSVAPGAANADTINSFVSADDQIVLDGTVYPNIGASGTFAAGDPRFDADAWVDGPPHPSFQDATDRVVYNTFTGQLWYDADGNGPGVAQLIATLQGAPALAAADITVVNGSAPNGQMIDGTEGDDSLTGGPGNDTIDGRGGDDTIRGLGGNDSLLGGRDGFDYVDGGDGDDTLMGTAGFSSDQTLVGGAGNDVLVGSWGQDVYEGGSGADIFQDEEGGDVYVYRAPSDGGDQVSDADDFDGNDTYVFDHAGFSPIGTTTFAPNDPRFYAAAGASSGRDADDRIIYDTASGRLYYDADGSGSGAATLIATIDGSPALSATDIVVAQFDSSGNWIIAGSPGNDRLTAAAGNDTINGAAGNDTLSGGRGANRLIGGDGNDELFSSYASPARDFDWYFATDTLDGGFGDDLYWVGPDEVILSDPGGVDTVVAADTDWTLGAGLENLRFSFDQFGGGPHTGIGNELNNTIHGGEFGGTLHGMGGNDLLVAYPRHVSGSTDLHGGDGDDTLQSGPNGDALFGDTGNDVLIAAAFGNNSLTGGAGADQFLFQEAPADATGVNTIADFLSATDKIVLDGNAYANSGPSGNFSSTDARFWSSGTGTAHDADDRVIYNTSNSQLWYDADGTGSGGAQLIATLPQGWSGETPANLAATDIAVINGSGGGGGGGGGGSTINGTSGNDTLSGTDGNDTINGLGGNDLFLAGSTGGADVIDGGTGFDSIEFRDGATSAVVVDFGASSISGGSSGTITFTNVERVVTGNFNDSLSGNASSQTLTGRGGADTLWGAGGGDTLWGGAGGDTFIFRETGTSNADRVSDWASGLDTLALDNAAMSALGADGDFVAGDARFASGPGFTAGRDMNDRVVFDTSTGRLYYDADGSGSGAAQLIATVQSGANVAATDIMVI